MRKKKSLFALTTFINLTIFGYVLLACDADHTLKNTQELSKKIQTPLVTYEILPYEISDEQTVTLIKTDVKNIFEDSAFILVVKANKGNMVYLDSLSFAVKKGDSATASIVFTQLEYDNNNPPKVEFIYK